MYVCMYIYVYIYIHTHKHYCFWYRSLCWSHSIRLLRVKGLEFCSSGVFLQRQRCIRSPQASRPENLKP